MPTQTLEPPVNSTQITTLQITWWNPNRELSVWWTPKTVSEA